MTSLSDTRQGRKGPHTNPLLICCRSGKTHTFDRSFDWLQPALVRCVLVLLCRFSIQFETPRTNVHFIIVEIRLFGAVATAHIACHLCVLDLFPSKIKKPYRCTRGASWTRQVHWKPLRKYTTSPGPTLKEGRAPSSGSIVARPDTIHTRSEPYSPSYSRSGAPSANSHTCRSAESVLMRGATESASTC